MLETAEKSAIVSASERVKTQQERIDAIESSIRKELNTFDPDVKHHFSFGVYGREMSVPAGTVVVGKIHKYESLNIMSKGRMLMLMDDGTSLEVSAPYTVVAPPGTRRVAYALEDSIWTTIHGTHERDLAVIEEAFIAQTPEEFQLFCERQLAIEGEKS